MQLRCGVGFAFPREIEVPHSQRRQWPDPARRPFNKRPGSLTLPEDGCSMRDDAMGVMRGDCVLVGVPRVGISRAAAVVFGLPLALMLVATVAAQWLSGAPLAGAAAGLAGGGALAWIVARRAGLDDWVDPVLVDIRARGLPPADDGRAAERQNG